tara:strand:- start:175 stop:540 length:366 start_codon:yes stop_codon:yes gene_type:complete
MKQEYQDFLFQFTSDDRFFCEPVTGVESILNELLSEITEKELIAYADSFEDRFLLGFDFFACAEIVAEKNKEKFLAFTWVMFRDGADDKKQMVFILGWDSLTPWNLINIQIVEILHGLERA